MTDTDKTTGDLIGGIHAVHAALTSDANRIRLIMVQKGVHNRRINALITLAENAGIAVKFTDKAAIDRKTGHARHQGIVAMQQPAPVRGETDLLQLLDRLNGPPFLLLLDSVTDPHNLGACLRTAEIAGVHAVIAPRNRCAPLNVTACKVACGAADIVPFITVTNLARTIRDLKERGIYVTGTAGEAAVSLFDADLTGPLALIAGAEDKGLRRLTRESCDTLVHIPVAGRLESLNVSVATGICLFEAVRQRGSHRALQQ